MAHLMTRTQYRGIRVALCATSCTLALVALFAFTTVCRVYAQDPEILIEDFEGEAPLSAWEVNTSSSEVSATFHVAEGHEGNGGYLSYDLPSRYEFVEATLLFTEPIQAYAISFWVKSHPDVYIMLGVADEFGSFHHFRPTRPFQATDPDGWYRHLIKFEDARVVGGVSIFVGLMDNMLQSSGEIAFDQIYSLTEPIVFQIEPESIPVAPATFSASTFHSILGADIKQREGPDEQALTIAQSVGTRYVRVGVGWHELENSPGYYNFSTIDSVVAEHQARGIKTIYSIHGGNPYHTGAWNNPPLTPAELTAFGNYVEAVAQQYRGQGMIYDIWSEPRNLVWNPPLQADQFAAILEEAIQRIRQADPTGQIVTGGIVHYDPIYVRDFINAGGVDGVDGFGVHSYNIRLPEALSENLLMVRSEFSQADLYPLPIWDTEWGFPSMAVGDETIAEARRRQAKLVARQYLSGWANGLSSVVYWSFRDDGEDPSQVYETFGLIDYDYNEKPSFQALRTLSEAASWRVLTGLIDDLPSDYFGFKLDGADDVLIVLWTKDVWAPLTVTVPVSSTAINFLGEPITLTPVSDTLVLTVSESSGPVYITCKLCPTTFTPSKVYLPVVFKPG
jgi:hypothetical protein